MRTCCFPIWKTGTFSSGKLNRRLTPPGKNSAISGHKPISRDQRTRYMRICQANFWSYYKRNRKMARVGKERPDLVVEGKENVGRTAGGNTTTQPPPDEGNGKRLNLRPGSIFPGQPKGYDSVRSIASAICRMLFRLSMASFCILRNASGSERL